MYPIRPVRHASFFFWTFMFLLVFLQLLADEDIVFALASTLSLAIVLGMVAHETIVRTVLLKRYAIDGDTARFIFLNLSSCTVTSLILTGVASLLFSALLPEAVLVDLPKRILPIFFGLFLISILFSGVSYSIALFKQNVEADKIQEKLKNSVLEMEIDQLRTQLSPHFTFNILNNLQFLIRKDKDEALDLLSRYSKILRYYVYESQHKWIKLDDEITFLKHYFKLETDRSAENLEVSFDLESVPTNDRTIIPFVLSTFIENAFKHVSAFPEQPNYIHLQICLEHNGELTLQIENSYDAERLAAKTPGVGLQYVRKRLDLSYPNNYSLTQGHERGVHEVALKLKLSR